jgi:hypothetical protein
MENVSASFLEENQDSNTEEDQDKDETINEDQSEERVKKEEIRTVINDATISINPVSF